MLITSSTPLSRLPQGKGGSAPSSLSSHSAGHFSVRFGGKLDQWMVNQEKNRISLYYPDYQTLPPFELNAVAVIPQNEAYTQTVLSLLDLARDSIKIDCFYIGGLAGNLILDKLQEKARQGVRIYYRGDQVDGLENREEVGKTKLVLKKLHQNLSDFLYIEHLRQDPFKRLGVNHNKLIIVDGNTVFLSSKNPAQGVMKNRDVSVVARGPIAKELSTYFNRNWALQTKQNIFDQPAPSQPLPPLLAQQMHLQISRPLITSFYKKNALPAMLNLINEAKSDIRVHGFCLTSQEILDAVIRAAKRGVHVQILLDGNFVYHFRMVNIVAFEALMKARKNYPNLELKAYYHQDLKNILNPSRKIMHQYKNHNKMLLADGMHAIVGSTNLSNADVWLQENVSVELGPGSATESLYRLFDQDWKQNAIPVRPPSWGERVVAFILKRLYQF